MILLSSLPTARQLCSRSVTRILSQIRLHPVLRLPPQLQTSSGQIRRLVWRSCLARRVPDHEACKRQDPRVYLGMFLTECLSLDSALRLNTSSGLFRPFAISENEGAKYLFIHSSFRSLHSLQDEEEEDPRDTSSTALSSSLHSINSHDASVTAAERRICHHGEVQLAGGMFRKKSQYLVLTDKHLVRFKSRSRASDVFPSIPASTGKRNDEVRHSRLSSSGSLYEFQASSTNDTFTAIPLNHIVAVYKLDDGRPYFSVEVAHLDQDRAAAMILRKYCTRNPLMFS